MSNEITLVKTSSGELVEEGTKNIELVENKLSEIETNLTNLADHSNTAVANLVELAIASQNPLYYEVLAKVLAAAAKVNHEAVVTVQAKLDLYRENHDNNKNAGVGDESETHITNVTNNLLMTTTEAIRAIMANRDKSDGSET